MSVDSFLVCGGCGRLISHAHNNASLLYETIHNKECNAGSIRYQFSSFNKKITNRIVIDHTKDPNPVVYHYK